MLIPSILFLNDHYACFACLSWCYWLSWCQSFVCLFGVFIHSRIFHSYGDFTITDDGLSLQRTLLKYFHHDLICLGFPISNNISSSRRLFCNKQIMRALILKTGRLQMVHCHFHCTLIVDLCSFPCVRRLVAKYPLPVLPPPPFKL